MIHYMRNRNAQNINGKGRHRAGSSMRLVRLKPPGPPGTMKIYKVGPLWAPKFLGGKYANIYMRGPQSLSCLRAWRDHDPALGRHELTTAAELPYGHSKHKCFHILSSNTSSQLVNFLINKTHKLN